jgi:predicted lipoprotein with Yx(FWY)xxD motif
MSKSRAARRHPTSLAVMFLLVAVGAVGVLGGSAAAHSNGSKAVVKEDKVKGKTILTTTNGHTLYSLSSETHGKFDCTKSSGCLSIWHPLKIAAGVKPTGPVKLGTVKRPEGGLQVTYRGLPLYSFIEDKRPGQVNGEGIKDVGTWHAATVR